MPRTPKKLKWLAVPLVLAIGATGVAQATQTDDVFEAPGCVIDATLKNGSFALEAQFVAETGADGTYEFKVKSAGGAGSTNIRQGGAFSAGNGDTVTLGKMTLGGSAVYDVSLEVRSAGETFTCEDRLGGAV